MKIIAVLLLSFLSAASATEVSHAIDECFTAEYISLAYDKTAREYVHDQRDRYYPLEDIKALHREIPKESNVLDAGCGSGIPIVDFFSKKGHKVTGVDLSPEMIKLARAHAPQAHNLQVGDIQELSFAANSFDLITSLYAIIHINREKQFSVFKNFYRMLKKGGIAYFNLCNKTYAEGKEEFHGTKEFNGTRLPYSYFSQKKYQKLLKKAGFKIISMKDIALGGYNFTWVKVLKP